MLNKVFLMGRLTRDPEFRQTTSGVPSCRFTVAVNRSYKDKQTGQKVEDTDFVDCTAWRQTAEFVSRYFTKGSMILVEGELRNNNYEDKNGVKHYGMNVLVQNVSFCGKTVGETAPNTAQQTAQRTAPASPAQASSGAPQPAQMTLDDLSDFEEILSDGEVPF